MRYSLRKHQEDYNTFLTQSKYLGAMAWHGMGLGKTLSSLDFVRKHLSGLRAVGVKTPKALVIMPKSAHSTWQSECNKWTPDIYRDLILLPYSQMHKAIGLCRLYDIRVIILDEWHYMKNPETNRAEALSTLLTAIFESHGGFNQGRILPLSGTPMPNGAHEWYTLWALLSSPNLHEAAIRILDKARYNKWKMTFSKRKEVKWKGRGGTTKQGASYEGTANEGMLTELLAPLVHFRRVADCVDLPEKQEITIDLNLPDDKLLADANIEEPDAYMALLERLGRAKTPHAIDWIRNFLATTDKQLVVFSMYKFALHEMAVKFKKDIVLYTGEESGNERKANLEAFQKGQKRIICMTYRAGSEALNLQNAHVGLYLGFPWTDGMLAQAMARIFRSGQTESTLHNFLMSGRNDARILSKVIAKGQATRKVEDNLLSLQGSQTAQIKLDTFL